jgi:hypothetical protein
MMLDMTVASFPFSKGRVAKGAGASSEMGATPHLVVSSWRLLFHISAVLLGPYENDNGRKLEISFLSAELTTTP